MQIVLSLFDRVSPGGQGHPVTYVPGHLTPDADTFQPVVNSYTTDPACEQQGS